MDEGLEEAALRVLDRKAGLQDVFVEQLFTFGEPARDPRTRVISVAYYALVDPARVEASAQDGRRLAPLAVEWEELEGEPVGALDEEDRPLPLAFDHARILGTAVARLRGKLDYAPIGFELLPDTFTLRQLQAVHEAVLGRAVNKDSFRRRMLASGQLQATGEREHDVVHRPAELYRFIRI